MKRIGPSLRAFYRDTRYPFSRTVNSVSLLPALSLSLDFTYCLSPYSEGLTVRLGYAVIIVTQRETAYISCEVGI
jgi:hypothetical protein